MSLSSPVGGHHREPLFQPADARAQPSTRDGDGVYGRFEVTSRIPAVLSRRELADGLGYSLHQIDTFRRAGTHPAVAVLPGPGAVRFSGAAVRRWLQGGAVAPVRRPLIGWARRG